MRKNPLNKGIIMENAAGIGTVTSEMVEARARPDGKQQTRSEKTKMPRDGARVRSFSKKASAKRSTIKCVRHRGRRRRATNQSHDRTTVIPVRRKYSNPSREPAVNRWCCTAQIPLTVDPAVRPRL